MDSIHTSRIDFTSGFCSWNSLRKSSLKNEKELPVNTIRKKQFFVEYGHHARLISTMLYIK